MRSQQSRPWVDAVRRPLKKTKLRGAVLNRTQVTHSILWLAFFLIYAATATAHVSAADSGEFQLVAAQWGIAHPPGYPLYTMMSALWIRLCLFGNPLFRLSLLSAALAATTLVLSTKSVRVWMLTLDIEESAAQAGGIASALLLGTAGTFWAQATIANIRMPTMLFTAWGYLALAHYQAATDNKQQEKALIELAIALGLGVGHHPSLIFVAVGWGVYLLLTNPKLLLVPQRWWKAALAAALAWFLPYLYLPLRGSMNEAALNPGNLNTWSGFWDHILARGFGGDMFAYATANDLALRLPMLPTLFRLQFPTLTLIALAAGCFWVLLRQRALGLSLLLSWGVHTFVTITYRAPQTVEYLMPAYLPMALVFGVGVAGLSKRQRRTQFKTVRGLVYIFFILMLLIRLPLQVPNFALLAADDSPRKRMAPLLETAPPDALILADWRWVTPLWVLQQVEGLRPDVEVSYVYPVKGQEYETVWQQRAVAAGERPLFTTHKYAWEDRIFIPIGGGYQVTRRPLTKLPDDLGFTYTDAELGPIKLLGYKLNGTLRPGRSVDLTLAWQATETQISTPSLTGRIWDANGALLTQADRSLGSDLVRDEIRMTQLTLQLPVDRCTERLMLTLGAYTVQDGAFQDLGATQLAEVTHPCTFPTLPTQRFHPGVVWQGGPFLKGVDYDVQGTSATAYLHWCGPGEGIKVQAGDQQALVVPLSPGKCQTVRLPVPVDTKPALQLTRHDGTPAQLLTFPLPVPTPGDRYIPFGDAMILTRASTTYRGENTVLNLRWLVARPIVDDYAVSTRLLDAQGQWIAMHDYQPGLSTMPTLKWVTRGAMILDPHPFSIGDAQPASFAIAVYERFRMTPLTSSAGDVVTLALDHVQK